MGFAYDLSEHGPTLATRPFAKELRADLLGRALGENAVELDFSGVRSISHSFADEFVCRLAEDAKTGEIDVEITVTGTSAEVERVIGAALGRRGIELPEPV